MRDTMLSYVTSYDTLLYCMILDYPLPSVLYHIVLYYIIPILHYTILLSSTILHSTLLYYTLCYKEVFKKSGAFRQTLTYHDPYYRDSQKGAPEFSHSSHQKESKGPKSLLRWQAGEAKWGHPPPPEKEFSVEAVKAGAV